MELDWKIGRRYMSLYYIYDVDERCADIDSTGDGSFFFAPCPRGLESVLVTELERLGATFCTGNAGGVRFQGDWRMCYRVTWKAVSPAVFFGEWQASLMRAKLTYIMPLARTLPWNEWFSLRLLFGSMSRPLKCPLRSLDFVTLKIKDAVCRYVSRARRELGPVWTLRCRIYAFTASLMPGNLLCIWIHQATRFLNVDLRQ